MKWKVFHASNNSRALLIKAHICVRFTRTALAQTGYGNSCARKHWLLNIAFPSCELVTKKGECLPVPQQRRCRLTKLRGIQSSGTGPCVILCTPPAKGQHPVEHTREFHLSKSELFPSNFEHVSSSHAHLRMPPSTGWVKFHSICRLAGYRRGGGRGVGRVFRDFNAISYALGQTVSCQPPVMSTN